MSTQSQNIASTLKRFVRRISAQQGDVATSAFSLAMLVFLVQKAQAASIADTPLDVAPTDKSDLDQVRQLFGNAAQDSVGDFDYSAIAQALAHINQRYEDASWSEEQALADMATGTDSSGDAPSAEADFATVESYLQDAVQYAQASQSAVATAGADAATAQPANVDGTALGGAPVAEASALGGLSSVLPFLLGGVALAAAGGGGGTSEKVVTPSGIELTEVTGTVVNGYVAGATVFQDLNGNNKQDSNEPFTTSRADGSFTLKVQIGSTTPIVIVGGTDISTGLAYSNILKGPPGATVITPLTTLVSALMASGKSQADAEAAVLKAFDLPPETKLLTFDPVAKADGADTQDLAVKIKAAGVLVANLMDSGGSALAGANGGDASALSYNIAQTIATKIAALTTDQTLDLGNTATLKSILTDSATSANLSTAQASKFNAISDSSANAISTVNGIVKAAATDSTKSAAEKFDEFAKAQTVAQGTLSDKIKVAADAGSASTIPNAESIKQDVEAVTPKNVAPTVATALSASATEGGDITTVNLLRDAKDLDVGDTAKLKVVGVTYTVGGAAPSLSIPPGLKLSDSGTLTVDPSNGAFNYLAVGQTQTITVSYKISDGSGGEVAQTATLTITGTINDATVISGETAKTLIETNAILTTNGKLIATDADNATAFVAQTDAAGSGGYGKFSIDADGAWTYIANTAHNEFVAGTDYTDTLTVSTSDGTSQVITVTITGKSQTVDITYSQAQTLLAAQTYYSADDVVTLNIDATDVPDDRIAAIANLKTLGVDFVDIGGDGKFHITAEEAGAFGDAKIAFVDDDTISLELTAAELSGADEISQGAGSYLNGTLANAVLGATGLGLADLHTLGVDFIDIGGSGINAKLHISANDVKAMDAVSLAFATADTITLDLTADELSISDDSIQGAGSYLHGSLAAAVSGATGLGLADLHTLGVDFIDIGGSGVNAKLHIRSDDAKAMDAASLAFATADTITLDLTPAELFSADDSSQGVGSYLHGSLAAAVSGATGLGLADLHTLGVDLIDIGGSDVSAKLHISTVDMQDMHDNGLGFASNDQIVLNINPESINSDETASGSYLNGTLDDAIYSSTGLHLTDLQKLGVDLIDIGGSDAAGTLHISKADAQAMKDAGLHFASGDQIFIDDVDNSNPGVSMNLKALATDQVEVDSGVMVTLKQDTDFALGADHSLNDLLIALGESGIVSGDLSDSHDFVASVAVDSDADIAINDSMVKALLDAGMLSVDKVSTIEVDTDSESMSTSLLQLVDIGTDKVVTSQDKAYVDLGDVAALGELSNLLSSLLEDPADTNLSTLFVHQANGESNDESALWLTADQASLDVEIQGDTSLLAQLTHVGITELLVAADDGVKGDVQMLGHEYHKQPIA